MAVKPTPTPLSRIEEAALRLQKQRPNDAKEILLAVRELRERGRLPQPIATVHHAGDRALLLYCPREGGWQTGVHFRGRWLDFATLSKELEPTHWMDVPPDPEAG